MLQYKIAVAKAKYQAKQAYKQAQKIAFATVLAEIVLVGGYAVGEYHGIFDIFRGESLQKEYINTTHASQKPEKVTEKPKNTEIDTIADTIWMLESTKGKNNYSKCTAEGKINGIGYGIPGNGKYTCFNTHAEEMETLRAWITKKQSQGITGKNLYCLYNTGKASDSCPYAMNAKK